MSSPLTEIAGGTDVAETVGRIVIVGTGMGVGFEPQEASASAKTIVREARNACFDVEGVIGQDYTNLKSKGDLTVALTGVHWFSNPFRRRPGASWGRVYLFQGRP